MKKMRQKIKFLFPIFLILISTSALISIDEYKGLSITINEDHFSFLYEMYTEWNSLYKLAKIEEPSKDIIQKALKKNFINMVNALTTNQGNIPKCVQDAFNKFLNDIKTPDQNGKPKATIEWKIYNDSTGRGFYEGKKYNKDFDDFYFQDIDSSTITFNGWDFDLNSNCGGDVPKDIQMEGNTWQPNTSHVNIYGAFIDKCQVLFLNFFVNLKDNKYYNRI